MAIRNPIPRTSCWLQRKWPKTEHPDSRHPGPAFRGQPVIRRVARGLQGNAAPKVFPVPGLNIAFAGTVVLGAGVFDLDSPHQ